MTDNFKEYTGEQMDNRRKITHEKIKNTFVEIAKRKDPGKIQVQELCAAAGINRSTFYDHFEYMDALIREVLKDRVFLICKAQDILDKLGNWEPECIPIESILLYIQSFRCDEVIQSFAESERAAVFRRIILEEQTRLTLSNVEKTDISLFYRAYFQNLGATSCIIDWISRKMPIPAEKLAEIIRDYSYAMYLGEGERLR